MKAEQNFEQAITELEEIVTLLEKGDLPLDDMLKHYEKGMKQAQFCQNALKEAQKKLEQFKTTQEQNEHDVDQ
jgi:exodeoxyribonuclease VII small subunit